MEQLSTEHIDVDCSGPPSLHIPTEVCENIIDMLYSDFIRDTYKHITTLHSCALVCRAWRVRSQRMLFYKVQLSTSISLHRLSTMLDTGQHLREYVYEVQLTGYHLHNTTSIFAVFPAVFARNLPNLCHVRVMHLHEHDETWFPRAPDPPKSRSLPYIPLQPRFPHFLSSFTRIVVLFLASTTFCSFSEFVRMLHGLPNLEELTCTSIGWITPGGAHPGADITMPPDRAVGRSILPRLAPKLRELSVWYMNAYGVVRLVRTRGPPLTRLELTIPLLDSPEDTTHGGTIDLSSCTRLEALVLAITPEFSVDRHAGFVEGLLTSWKPQHLRSTLTLYTTGQDQFSRQGFGDVLRGVGVITERWIQAVTPDGDFHSHHGVQYQLHIIIYDLNAEKGRWWDHLASCFPTWLKLGWLHLDFLTPRWTHDIWAGEEQSPQPDALAVASQVHEIASSSQSKPESQETATESPQIAEHA